AEELFNAALDGSLEEVWGTGTAAVISPVGHLRQGDTDVEINGGGIGELSQKLYDTITGIQLGKIEGPQGWVVEVE
ncbi:MAG: branched chain amino acid aminotransferase, partial [Lachnospiraceae bacterium]|nr:branched chain amino acid aminotransferase [Lachnospiraceae bacterium]